MPLDRHAQRNLRLWAGALVCFICVAAVVFAEVAGAAPQSQSLNGVVTLKPLPTRSCKSGTGTVRGRKETDFVCYGTGVYQGSPASGGASYSWTWYARTGDPVLEKGVIAIILGGKGAAYLKTAGVFKTVGKATTAFGRARTTGRWSFSKGTAAYKGAKGSGTFTLDLQRDATTYRVLKVTVAGSLD